MTTHALLGTPVLRVEDPALLVGDSTFVANLDLEGALVAHFITSEHSHAKILGVDTAAAKQMPGVVEVLSAADLDFGPLPGLAPGVPESAVRMALAVDRVRFVGEAIAVVVAESMAEAADAAELVVVDYEPLPAVVDPLAAIDSDVLLFPEAGTNVMQTGSGANDEPYDFSTCEVVIDLETTNQRVAPCPLETRVAASMWTEDGRLLHYAACQGVHPIRRDLATFYNLEPEQIRVVTADVGGSFGAKSRVYPEDILLPFLAKITGRPVRWTPDRRSDMVGLGHSRAQRQRIKIGGSSDGKIDAIEAEIIGDCGAYPITAFALMRNAGLVLPGPLNIPNVRWSGKVVVTNTTPVVAYRGAGRPEGGAMLNRGIDRFAAEIGMDPLDVRRKNLLEVEDLPWENPTGLVYDSGDYRQGLELAASEIDNEGVRARQQQEREAGATVLTGIGWGTFIDRTAGIPSDDYGCLELRADGSFRVLTSSSPYGQGHYTSWAMLVSERTGVPVADINVIHGDTDIIPMGGITGGSRSTQRAGSAVAEATDELVEKAKLKAADLLEAAVGDVVLDVANASFHVAGAPGAASVGWAELATDWNRRGQQEEDGDDEDVAFSCESQFQGDGPSVPYGMYVAVVEVDTETGHVVLRRMLSVDDAGTILNPLLLEGQLHGGIAQGIGQAMFEEFCYDDQGNPLTSSFLDYGFPSAAEMPMFDVHVLESPSPNNPLGFKGVAESGCIGAVPAIQNAVIDAVAHLGVRHIELPVTPQRVWQAIREATES